MGRKRREITKDGYLFCTKGKHVVHIRDFYCSFNGTVPWFTLVNEDGTEEHFGRPNSWCSKCQRTHQRDASQYQKARVIEKLIDDDPDPKAREPRLMDIPGLGKVWGYPIRVIDPIKDPSDAIQPAEPAEPAEPSKKFDAPTDQPLGPPADPNDLIERARNLPADRDDWTEEDQATWDAYETYENERFRKKYGESEF